MDVIVEEGEAGHSGERVDLPRPAAGSISDAAAFLEGYSLEVTSRQLDQIGDIARRTGPGRRVFIAFLDESDWPRQAAVATALRRAGLEPVPHIPARYLKDAVHLEDVLARLRGEADVGTVLAIGGDVDRPRGVFDGVPAMLAAGALEAHGIRAVGFAGHPEGQPVLERACGDAGLVGVLADKVSYAREVGMTPFVVTQFSFEAAPVLEWLDVLSAAGLDVTVHAGLAGPARVKTLLAFALRCGVGRSARVLKRQGVRMARLLSEAPPDGIVEVLAEARAQGFAPELGAPHFFPFGGTDRLFDWIDSVTAA